MAEVWVVNSSPLIVLDRLGRLDLLARLGNTLIVPGGVLAEIYDKSVADKVRILYGGSVKPENVKVDDGLGGSDPS